MTLDDVIRTFRRWMDLPDPTPLLAVLASVAANLLGGDPCWIMLVGPPSSGKTEILGAFVRLPYVHVCATLTEAALLSGTPKRDTVADARGGLLRVIGDFGVLMCKDFGSIMSQHRETMAAVLAALREIYDGSWTRHVGVDGGKTMHWEGHVGLIAGCTPTIDRHHAVMAAMGERIALCRMPETDADVQAARALAHVGREGIMRAELSDAVMGLFATIDVCEAPVLTTVDRARLIDLATFVVRCRSAVERDGQSRDIELIPDAEAPGRLVTMLARFHSGLAVIGADAATQWAVVRRVGLDSMPAIRWRVINALADGATRDTSTIAVSIDYPTTTTRRTLEDLTAHGIVVRESQGQGKADTWTLSTWALTKLAALGVPEMSGGNIGEGDSINNPTACMYENRERSPDQPCPDCGEHAWVWLAVQRWGCVVCRPHVTPVGAV